MAGCSWAWAKSGERRHKPRTLIVTNFLNIVFSSGIRERKPWGMLTGLTRHALSSKVCRRCLSLGRHRPRKPKPGNQKEGGQEPGCSRQRTAGSDKEGKRPGKDSRPHNHSDSAQ